MTVPKCTSIWGHKFEARYSSEPINGEFGRTKVAGQNALDALMRLRCVVSYEADICVRCGHLVEHKTPPKSTD